MELNLALSAARTRNSTHGRPRLGRFCGDVRLRETRCSYFLNLILQGLRTDEIEVEMEKERSVILRGETYCKEVGMLKWRWRLMANDAPTPKRRRPFKIPEDVNVGATRGNFEKNILHLVMPKFKYTRFSPYHLILHSSRHHHMQNGNAHKPQAASSPTALNVINSSCSYTSEIINKDTIYSSTSSVSNAYEKKQQYRRTRRRMKKVAMKSQNVE